ncbi:hypothetical protein M0P25_04760 [archaeon]|jgi:hypothetical protein|nr:hypothetical protein [archaeon]MCK9439606.1 hypothetical protein [Patescibacteria group bacterium]
MKIEEFKKYKYLIESELIDINDDEVAASIYKWMDETGRLDEGFWGSIWGWLKRNFSPTARKLHKLADQYEDELMQETRAEFGKEKDRKDIRSKIRTGYYSRMSNDIEERMDIIASDDQDYRELVRILINQKKLKVKKAMLTEFAGVFDEDEADEIKSKYEKEEKNIDAKLKANEDKLKQNLPDFRKLSDQLNQDIQADGYFRKLLDRDQRARFIGVVISYVNTRAEKSDKVTLDEKTLKNTAMKCGDLIRKVDEKTNRHKQKVAPIEILRELQKLLVGSDKPFEDISKELFHNVEKLESEDYSEEIAPEHAEEILDKKPESIPVETKKEYPDTKEKEVAIKDASRKYFNNKDNFELIMQSMDENIEKFNNESEENRKKYSYLPAVNDKFKIDLIDEEETKKLADNFIKVAGYIVPYYITHYSEKKSIHRANQTVAQCLFYIYLFSDKEGKMDDRTLNHVVDLISMSIEEPLTFKTLWSNIKDELKGSSDFKNAK